MRRLHGPARRHPQWAATALAAKVLVVAGFVILPAEFAVSLGAVHGVALAVTACVVAAVLVIRRRRRSARPAQPHHRHDSGHGHDGPARRHQDGGGAVRRPDHRLAAEIVKEGKDG